MKVAVWASVGSASPGTSFLLTTEAAPLQHGKYNGLPPKSCPVWQHGWPWRIWCWVKWAEHRRTNIISSPLYEGSEKVKLIEAASGTVVASCWREEEVGRWRSKGAKFRFCKVTKCYRSIAWHSAHSQHTLCHRGHTQGLRAASGPLPCFIRPSTLFLPGGSTEPLAPS